MNAIAPSSAPAAGPALDNRRVLAALIDLVVVVVGTVLLSTIVGMIAGGDGGFGPQMGLVSLGWALYYYFALESGDGQTLGKKVMKLRVVRADGGRTGMQEIAIRTVLRIVDGIMVYLVGLVVMLISGEKRQRLGDMAAGTIVVDASVDPAPAAPAAMAAPVMAPPVAPTEDADVRAHDAPPESPSFPVASSGPADVGTPLPEMSAPENPAPPPVTSFNPFADTAPAAPAAQEQTVEAPSPEAEPSVEPVEPSVEPASEYPSVEPVVEPTVEPSVEPYEPTVEPSVEPAASEPSVEPSVEPDASEPAAPESVPFGHAPDAAPSVEPVVESSPEPPVEAAASEPADESSDVPPGYYPTGQPIEEPTVEPSVQLAASEPADESNDVPPGYYPTGQPIEEPTVEPSVQPAASEPIVDSPSEPAVAPADEASPNGSGADLEDDEPTVSVKSVETVSPMDLIMGDEEDDESSRPGQDDGPAA